MPDNKKTITWRSEAYSDISDSPPFRKHVVQQTEDAFARLLLREVRERGGRAAVTQLQEGWLNSGSGGKIYEISAEVADGPERAAPVGAGPAPGSE